MNQDHIFHQRPPRRHFRPFPSPVTASPPPSPGIITRPRPQNRKPLSHACAQLRNALLRILLPPMLLIQQHTVYCHGTPSLQDQVQASTSMNMLHHGCVSLIQPQLLKHTQRVGCGTAPNGMRVLVAAQAQCPWYLWHRKTITLGDYHCARSIQLLPMTKHGHSAASHGSKSHGMYNHWYSAAPCGLQPELTFIPGQQGRSK